VWLRAHGREVDVHLYPEGHHANSDAEQVRHMELILDFFVRHTT
jgi:dipeptidyl aminopeptidase/acylaminoacyl peptidase